MPLLASLASGRLTQGFLGTFSWEGPGYVRTDTDVDRGARTRWHMRARYMAHVHLASDIAVSIGAPVRAMKGGVIASQGVDSSGAWFVWLRLRRGRVFDVYQLAYHLKPYSLRHPLGGTVRKGQTLGLSGASGYVTGPHLHEEIVRAPRGAGILHVYRYGIRFPIGPFRRGAITVRAIAP